MTPEIWWIGHLGPILVIMNFEATKSEIRTLLLEVTSNNFQEYYGKFEKVILAYKKSGGKGKLLHEYLIALDNEMGDVDDWKEEHLLDMINRITGHTGLPLRIVFDDFDQQTGQWI